MTEPKLRIISLGAGVQSTTLAIMATIDEAGLSTAADHGQLDLFANECEEPSNGG